MPHRLPALTFAMLVFAAGLGAAHAQPAQAQDSGRAAPAREAPQRTPRADAARATPAPGGGPNLVWVNTASKAYHCPTDKYYGRTKRGEYMAEDAAKAAGARHRGRACF